MTNKKVPEMESGSVIDQETLSWWRQYGSQCFSDIVSGSPDCWGLGSWKRSNMHLPEKQVLRKVSKLENGNMEFAEYEIEQDTAEELEYYKILVSEIPSAVPLAYAFLRQMPRYNTDNGTSADAKFIGRFLDVLNENAEEFWDIDNMLLALSNTEFSRKFVLYQLEKAAAEAHDGSVESSVRGDAFLSFVGNYPYLFNRTNLYNMMVYINNKYGKVFPSFVVLKNSSATGSFKEGSFKGIETNEACKVNLYTSQFFVNENLMKLYRTGASSIEFYKTKHENHSEITKLISKFLMIK